MNDQPLMAVPPRTEPTTKQVPIPSAFPESRADLPATSRVTKWAFGILALLMLGGSLGYYLLYPSGEAPAAFQPKEEVPALLLPYRDKAAQGDPNAMYMLGTMYYNGLNVRQNRKEGIRWYRKAAAAGSVAARKDLEQLGLAADAK